MWQSTHEYGAYKFQKASDSWSWSDKQLWAHDLGALNS